MLSAPSRHGLGVVTIGIYPASVQPSAGKRLPFDQDSIVVAMLNDPLFDVRRISRTLIFPYEPKHIDVIDLDSDSGGLRTRAWHSEPLIYRFPTRLFSDRRHMRSERHAAGPFSSNRRVRSPPFPPPRKSRRYRGDGCAQLSH